MYTFILATNNFLRFRRKYFNIQRRETKEICVAFFCVVLFIVALSFPNKNNASYSEISEQ